MKVSIPEPLLSYTARERQVEAEGRTIGELLADLERRFPGIRFRMVDEQERIRPHMRIFVNGERAGLHDAVGPDADVQILQALSGG